MKLIFADFAIVVCLLAVAEAFTKEYELQPGIPTSLLEVENQQLSQISGEQSPLAREKRHKKKVVVVNQYYGRPGYHGGYGQGGCPGCGGYGYGNSNYGYGYQGGYQGYGGYQGGHSHGGYQGGYGGYGGHGGGHKFKG